MTTQNSTDELGRDVRWVQRFASYKKALSQLTQNVKLSRARALSRIETEGLIKSFEYTYELAWNTIKDFYLLQGDTGIQGSRDAFRLAFNRGLITRGHVFMDMITSRQLSVHTYNEETSAQIHAAIVSQYYDTFRELESTFDEILKK